MLPTYRAEQELFNGIGVLGVISNSHNCTVFQHIRSALTAPGSPTFSTRSATVVLGKSSHISLECDPNKGRLAFEVFTRQAKAETIRKIALDMLRFFKANLGESAIYNVHRLPQAAPTCDGSDDLSTEAAPSRLSNLPSHHPKYGSPGRSSSIVFLRTLQDYVSKAIYHE